MKLLILLFLIVNSYATPTWYLNVKAKNSYEIIGFGEGTTLKEAKLFAKDDIAKQIQTSVASTAQRDVSLHNEELHKSFSSRTIEKTNVELQDVKLIESAKVNDTFYVALSYENLSFEKRFTKNVKKTKCSDELQNPYLSSTHLFKKLNDAIGCKLNIKLLRKNSAWYLTYKEYMQVVPKNIFEELFISTTNKNFGFIPSQSKLLQGDQFYFNFESKQNAYLSVLDVYEDGTVSIIYENKKIFKNKQLKVPDENFEYNLEAGLYEEGKATYDIFDLMKNSGV